MERLAPAPEPQDLPEPDAEHEVVISSVPLWRIFFAGGEHGTRRPTFRAHGPVPAGRFDPHPPPPGDASGESVLYTATDLVTCLAETFQETRLVDRLRREPQLAAWHPTRELRLLDLTGGWPLRAGAGGLINSGARVTSQGWARAIRRRWPDLDGLLHRSSLTQTPTCAALWTPAAATVPRRLELSRPLADPELLPWLVPAAQQIGYRLL